jgi:chemotaxis response regulator CheB
VTKKRVIVLEIENLLSAGISSLLSTNGKLEVIGLTFEEAIFHEAVNHFKPEVVIVDEQVLDQNLNAFSAILKNYPKVRTIVMSMGTNSFQICDKELIQVQHLDDFLEQIEA